MRNKKLEKTREISRDELIERTRKAFMGTSVYYTPPSSILLRSKKSKGGPQPGDILYVGLLQLYIHSCFFVLSFH
jgi:hypothetical protein